MYQNPDLEKIRRRIDELDNTVHDLLMERAELIDSISEAKRKNNIQIVQPAREAKMIRRLLGRHQGILPARAIVRIWRELVGAITLLQTGLSVSAYIEKNFTTCWDLLKNYFGSVLPIKEANSYKEALADVRNDVVTFAALPWPAQRGDCQWWDDLLDDENNEINTIVALTESMSSEGRVSCIEKSMLIVAKMGLDDSGNDNTFIVVQSEVDLSDDELVAPIVKQGFLHNSIYRSVSDCTYSYLIEINGFISVKDELINEIRSDFTKVGAKKIRHVGGYPIPAFSE